jgi:hypothetical protein
VQQRNLLCQKSTGLILRPNNYIKEYGVVGHVSSPLARCSTPCHFLLLRFQVLLVFCVLLSGFFDFMKFLTDHHQGFHDDSDLIVESTGIWKCVVELRRLHVQSNYVVRELANEGLGAFAESVQTPKGITVFPKLRAVPDHFVFEVGVCATGTQTTIARIR